MIRFCEHSQYPHLAHDPFLLPHWKYPCYIGCLYFLFWDALAFPVLGCTDARVTCFLSQRKSNTVRPRTEWGMHCEARFFFFFELANSSLVSELFSETKHMLWVRWLVWTWLSRICCNFCFFQNQRYMSKWTSIICLGRQMLRIQRLWYGSTSLRPSNCLRNWKKKLTLYISYTFAKDCKGKFFFLRISTLLPIPLFLSRPEWVHWWSEFSLNLLYICLSSLGKLICSQSKFLLWSAPPWSNTKAKGSGLLIPGIVVSENNVKTQLSHFLHLYIFHDKVLFMLVQTKGAHWPIFRENFLLFTHCFEDRWDTVEPAFTTLLPRIFS